MKAKNITLFAIVIAFLFPLFLCAQTPVTGILYTYDASGNRVKREPAPQQQGRKANPNAEEKKESVVAKNNIVASFTPNPTVTGNFTVMVSKKDFTTTQNAVSEKPQIFIYNPIGELIHQESAQFDNQVNINLSSRSRGIYLVKIQSGEEVLMHRMVYE